MRLRTLDLGLLQAGAGVKGEFENRLKRVIAEVKASPHPDHSVHRRGAHHDRRGRAGGQDDAANLLKPALARGELRTIAATTWAEYKKYFEKDAALARRFQVVKVEEPGEEVAVRMMAGSQRRWRNITACESWPRLSKACKLSHRYMPGRQLPDKGRQLARHGLCPVAIGQMAIPRY